LRVLDMIEKEVPDKSDSQVVIGVVIPVVVDTETIGIKVTNIDAIAIGGRRKLFNPIIFH